MSFGHYDFGHFVILGHFVNLGIISYNPGFSHVLLGQIRLPHLRIHKYFTDDSSVNFLDKVFLHFLSNSCKKNKEKYSHGNLQMSRP